METPGNKIRSLIPPIAEFASGFARWRTLKPAVAAPIKEHLSGTSAHAADAAAVVEHLNLGNTIHIGHSTGGGEATRYVARHRNRVDWWRQGVMGGAKALRILDWLTAMTPSQKSLPRIDVGISGRPSGHCGRRCQRRCFGWLSQHPIRRWQPS